MAARQYLETGRERQQWGEEGTLPTRAAGGRLFARYVYFPPRAIYERAGLVPAGVWRARALANRQRCAHAGEMLRPTIEFLHRAGWQVSTPYAG